MARSNSATGGSFPTPCGIADCTTLTMTLQNSTNSGGRFKASGNGPDLEETMGLLDTALRSVSSFGGCSNTVFNNGRAHKWGLSDGIFLRCKDQQDTECLFFSCRQVQPRWQMFRQLTERTTKLNLGQGIFWRSLSEPRSVGKRTWGPWSFCRRYLRLYGTKGMLWRTASFLRKSWPDLSLGRRNGIFKACLLCALPTRKQARYPRINQPTKTVGEDWSVSGSWSF